MKLMGRKRNAMGGWMMAGWLMLAAMAAGCGGERPDAGEAEGGGPMTTTGQAEGGAGAGAESEGAAGGTESGAGEDGRAADGAGDAQVGDGMESAGDAGAAGSEETGAKETAGVTMETAAQLYAGICQMCHGPGGEGMPGLGSSLVDGEWVHARTDAEIAKVIKEGLMDKGLMMQGYGSFMNDEEVTALIGYLRKLERDAKAEGGTGGE